MNVQWIRRIPDIKVAIIDTDHNIATNWGRPTSQEPDDEPMSNDEDLIVPQVDLNAAANEDVEMSQ